MKWSLLVLFLTIGSAVGQKPAGEKLEKPFVVFPVATQLQKDLLLTKSSCLILLNGDLLTDREGRVRASVLDLPALRNDLSKADRAHTNEALSCVILFNDSKFNEDAYQVLKFALKGWAQDEHLEAHAVSVIGENGWDQLMRITGDKRGLIQEKLSEDRVDGPGVRVYPVRTALSRYCTRDSVCVIRLLKPFPEGFDGSLDEETRKAVVAAVGKLEFERKGPVSFSVHWSVSAKAVERFFEKDAKALAKELGFNRVEVGRE